MKAFNDRSMKAEVSRAFLAHCLALAKLGRIRGGSAAERIFEGAEIWRRLRRVENRMRMCATRFCNGFATEADIDQERLRSVRDVGAIMGGPLRRLRINLDPRGCALKLADPPTGLQRDWGGDGMLAPDYAGRS